MTKTMVERVEVEVVMPSSSFLAEANWSSLSSSLLLIVSHHSQPPSPKSFHSHRSPPDFRFLQAVDSLGRKTFFFSHSYWNQIGKPPQFLFHSKGNFFFFCVDRIDLQPPPNQDPCPRQHFCPRTLVCNRGAVATVYCIFPPFYPSYVRTWPADKPKKVA